MGTNNRRKKGGHARGEREKERETERERERERKNPIKLKSVKRNLAAFLIKFPALVCPLNSRPADCCYFLCRHFYLRLREMTKILSPVISSCREKRREKSIYWYLCFIKGGRKGQGKKDRWMDGWMDGWNDRGRNKCNESLNEIFKNIYL